MTKTAAALLAVVPFLWSCDKSPEVEKPVEEIPSCDAFYPVYSGLKTVDSYKKESYDKMTEADFQALLQSPVQKLTAAFDNMNLSGRCFPETFVIEGERTVSIDCTVDLVKIYANSSITPNPFYTRSRESLFVSALVSASERYGNFYDQLRFGYSKSQGLAEGVLTVYDHRAVMSNDNSSPRAVVYDTSYLDSGLLSGTHTAVASGLRVMHTVDVPNVGFDLVLCKDPAYDTGCPEGQIPVDFNKNKNTKAMDSHIQYEGYFCVTQTPLTDAEQGLPELVRKMHRVAQAVEAVDMHR